MTHKTSLGLLLGGALVVAAGYGATATQAATPHADAHSGSRALSMVMPQTVYRASGPVVRIKNYTFHAPLSVKKGARVTIKNKDGVAHTFTSNAGLFGARVPAHSSRTVKAPSKAGAYKFHCIYHANMHGTLHVG